MVRLASETTIIINSIITSIITTITITTTNNNKNNTITTATANTSVKGNSLFQYQVESQKWFLSLDRHIRFHKVQPGQADTPMGLMNKTPSHLEDQHPSQYDCHRIYQVSQTLI